MPASHAFEFLTRTPENCPDVVAVYGNDSTLRSWSIAAVVGDDDRTDVEGDATAWSDIRDDLATASLFDMGGKKSIVIRGGDKFVSAHRGQIEDYLAKPTAASRLIIETETLASNTKIYKAIDKHFRIVFCGNASDSKKGISAASRRKFVSQYIAPRHQCKIDKDAIDSLFEMLGDDLGMIDTEIAKLSVCLPLGETIGTKLVDDVVGGWQGKTVWQITDAIAVGDAAEALKQLDKLITGGQKPVALLPQIAWGLRRLGLATTVVQYFERSGRAWRLEDAVAAAGIRRPGEVGVATQQLRSLGRDRGTQLLPWLLDA
ncbi:MAG: DNA polymerase III subunit delta, partial [Planctomycetota bacterium]